MIGGGSSDLPTDTTAIIDLKQPTPIVRVRTPDQRAEAVRERRHPARPDGVPDQRSRPELVISHRSLYPYVHNAEIYHPDTNTWTTLRTATVGRGYHSEAILLARRPGRHLRQQLVRRVTRAAWEQRIEIYKPVYWDKPRPVISVDSAQAQVPLGGSFTLLEQQAAEMGGAGATLLGHALDDPEQRLVDLPFTQDPTNQRRHGHRRPEQIPRAARAATCCSASTPTTCPASPAGSRSPLPSDRSTDKCTQCTCNSRSLSVAMPSAPPRSDAP